MPEVGQPAPAFTLPGTDGKDHALADYRGKNVVLFFFPRAFTGTCERQISTHAAPTPTRSTASGP
jgi:peroxiredoxin Q/BCP